MSNVSNIKELDLDLIKTQEACKILKVNRYTLYKLIRNKEITAYWFAGRYMFDKKELLDFLEKHKVKVE